MNRNPTKHELRIARKLIRRRLYLSIAFLGLGGANLVQGEFSALSVFIAAILLLYGGSDWASYWARRDKLNALLAEKE